MNATSALGWSLLHFLWQGALIALAANLVPVDAAAPSCTWALRRGGLRALALMPLTVVYRWRVRPAAVRRRCRSSAHPLRRRSARRARCRRRSPPSRQRGQIEALDEAQIASSFPSSALALSTRPWKQHVSTYCRGSSSRGRWAWWRSPRGSLAGCSAVRRLVRGARAEPESVEMPSSRAPLDSGWGIERAVRVCASAA